MTEKEKFNNFRRNYVFSVIVLSLFLCASLVFNFLGGFRFDYSKSFELELGDDCVIKMNDIGVSSVAYAVDGTILPGEKIKQQVKIQLPNLALSNLTLRVKIELNNQKIDVFGYNYWFFDENDCYFYFNDLIYQNQNIGFCEEIEIDEDANFLSNKIYFMVITCELISV